MVVTMRIYATLLAWMLCANTAVAANLTPCPDCEQMVSPRAVMCPHCGCPGDAIKEAVAEREAADMPPPPKTVVKVTTDQTIGHAVALLQRDSQYIVMDAALLADTSSLAISLLKTGDNIAYQRMQIAPDVPLVRFRIDTEDVLSRPAAPNADNTPLSWLNIKGEATPLSESSERPADAIALVDANEYLVSFLSQIDRSAHYPMPPEQEWKDVAPGVFRAQMRLLSAASAAGTPSDADIQVLKNTPWLSPFLEDQARQIITKAKETR